MCAEKGALLRVGPIIIARRYRYRVYFGRDGEVLMILLTGGTKKRQQRDIDAAKMLWADYKRRRPRAR
jgi:putative addiction module killer protein